MAKLAVLLRGVNVGGHAKLPMADLRAVLESLGYTGVQTYLQSGNAVVDAGRHRPADVEAQVHRGLAAELGLSTAVLVRTHAELAGVIAANPFPHAVAQPKFLHVAFLSVAPDPAKVAELDPERYAPERYAFGADRELYLYFANGAGRSKMSAAAPLRVGGVATARNWNTVLKLADLTD